MSLLLAMVLAVPPAPSAPMSRVTICWQDGGDCRGMGGGGGLTDAQLRASAVSVSCTNCSGGGGGGLTYIADAGVLNVNFPATQAVTGTFWQATQPISGNVGISAALPTGDNAIGRVIVTSAPTTAVTGTFFQATQPVSIAATTIVTEGSATRWSCFKQAITATTECQATPGAGQRLYVTSIACSNGAATVQGVDVVYGTGANCVTGITALTHKLQMGTNGLTTSPFLAAQQFLTPLVPPQNVAICVRPTAATAFGCTLTGYTAP